MIEKFNKIYSLFTQKQRYQFFLLFFLMLVGMLLETLGIGLIIPFLGIMMQDRFLSKYPEIEKITEYFGITSQSELIHFAILALIIIYIIKNIYLGFLYWKQTRFSYDLQTALSLRIFSLYIKQDYAFHLQRNSSLLLRNVISEVNVLGTAMNAALVLTTELLVLSAIVFLLIAAEPYGAIIVSLILGSSAYVFLNITKRLVKTWGEKRQFHDGLMRQHAVQAFGGIKDIILLGREKDFIGTFQYHNKKNMRSLTKQAVLQHLPRLWLEILAVIGLGAVVAVMLNRGQTLTNIIPVIGLFAIAAFRMIPSVNRILLSMQSLRFGSAAINLLHQEITLATDNLTKVNIDLKPQNNLKFINDIKINKVEFQYSNAKQKVLSNVSLQICKGQSVGFIGTSGSGKSTLVDIIMGLLTPSAGDVLVDDKSIFVDLRSWQHQLGYVPQSIYLADDTLRKNIAFGIPESEIDPSALARAVKLAQLNDFINTQPNGIDTIVGERGVRLSGGQRQRIGIARALYHDPDILILDEATSALDSDTEASVMQAIKALHGIKTTIIIAHRLSTVAHCDQIYRLEHGEIIESGLPGQMLLTDLTSNLTLKTILDNNVN